MNRLLVALVMLSLLVSADAEARRRRRPRKKPPTPAADIVVGDDADAADAKTKQRGKEKVFDFTGLSIEGKLRTPQLLYFLGRARQELERAALESRSFIPEMVQSVEKEGL